MPGPRNRTGTDPSLNHPLTMPYMGAGSGREKRLRRGDFHPPLPGGGSRPEGTRGGVGRRRVTVAGKPSDDMAPGTLNSVLKQALLKELK